MRFSARGMNSWCRTNDAKTQPYSSAGFIFTRYARASTCVFSDSSFPPTGTASSTFGSPSNGSIVNVKQMRECRSTAVLLFLERVLLVRAAAAVHAHEAARHPVDLAVRLFPVHARV